MKHIELLTMESYLKEKKVLVKNAGYTLKELHIDHVERLKEIIEEIMKEYFRKEEQESPVYINYRKKGNYYEIWVSDSVYISPYMFLEDLETSYRVLIQEKREKEIVEDIKKVLSTVFIFSCRFPDSVINKTYEIIKYTLSEERQCDYLDNGKFIAEMSVGDGDIFPFEKKNDKLPLYCQNMQRVLFGVHRRIFVNPDNYLQSLDITRFSFYNVKKIVDAVTKTLTIEENGMDYKEDSKDYNDGYVEGVEDYILLDEILGISLTNIIYWKTKEIEERKVQDNIIKIVPYLAKCRYSIGRNSVAQVLLDYLKATNYNGDIIREVGEMLKKEIKVWNEYYEEVEAVVLCPLFRYLKERPVNDLIEVCKSIDDKSAWGEYIYMDEIIKDNEKKKEESVNNKKKDENVENDEKKKEDKIRVPKGDMNSKTWYAYIHKIVFDAIWS